MSISNVYRRMRCCLLRGLLCGLMGLCACTMRGGCVLSPNCKISFVVGYRLARTRNNALTHSQSIVIVSHLCRPPTHPPCTFIRTVLILIVPNRKDDLRKPYSCPYIRQIIVFVTKETMNACLLYTSPSPRDKRQSRMPSSA